MVVFPSLQFPEVPSGRKAGIRAVRGSCACSEHYLRFLTVLDSLQRWALGCPKAAVVMPFSALLFPPVLMSSDLVSSYSSTAGRQQDQVMAYRFAIGLWKTN
jgi:hypothetical protein